MAEEPQVAAASPAETTVEEVVVKPEAEEKENELKKPALEAVAVEVAEEAKKPAEKEETVVLVDLASLKEESNLVGDLPEAQKKALEEFKELIREALEKHEFSEEPAEKPVKAEEPSKVEAAAEEAGKPEAEADEVAKPAVAAEEPPKCEAVAAEEPPKVEEAAKTEAVVVAAAVVVDDDGAKTVEAIEETVVAVAAVVEPPVEKTKETETTEAAEEPLKPALEPEKVEIWGVPLLADERSNVVLLKFLRARDFKVKEAFAMIKNTVRWRKEFGIEALLEEDLGNDLNSVVFMNGFGKEGHPVCYNVYGEFQKKELYEKAFGDTEKRQKFLRWRIQFLERSIRSQLDFSPTGICTIIQVTDLKNSPGPAKRELRQATNQALNVLQDNYPEFVAKQVLINVPWWYLAFNRMISPFLTQRMKSKFVYAGPSKSADTLFRYIAPEQVPVQYGGLKKEGDADFSTADPVTEITVKPASKYTVELPVTEASTVTWELRVPGWDVSYGAEFVPSSEDGYTIIIQKLRKMSSSDEPVVKNNFKTGESGKVVLTIDNTTSKKKKLLYRSKTKASCESAPFSC